MSEEKTYHIARRDYQTTALFIIDGEGEVLSEPMETMDEAMKALEEI
tara:strand:+ start:310 stop:450 length:141 start_codon:yes stop_codon:yes gene_type:complete